MAGIRTTSGIYYVCGSRPYRKGMACGPGVYVSKDGIEADVITGLSELLDTLSDGKGFARDMNEELRHIWEQHTGHAPDTAQRPAEVERKIGNLWAAIGDRLTDVATANARLRALQAQCDELRLAAAVVGEPPQSVFGKHSRGGFPGRPGPPLSPAGTLDSLLPASGACLAPSQTRSQIDVQVATAYQRQAEKMMAEGTLPERKQLLRAWVADMKLAPDALEVETTYQIPEPVMHSEVAGAGFAEVEKTQARRWMREIAFWVSGNVAETISRSRRMHGMAPDQASGSSKVAGW